ncbi:helix-turn-helix domain-containing protein [Saccharopolyspora sp. CA-218241]|uniref:helix-turn-helix domain-containing protein n=1 Tax=Saccharopolyspora sp. CA-218241 TaxID=3240027 RepID=UPI003D9598B1
MSSQSLGEHIKALRGRLYTQRELAERAGVSVDLVRKLEQGSRNTASVASLHRLARALDVSLADLIGRGHLPEQEQSEGVTALRHAVAGVDDLIGPADGSPLTAHEAERADVYVWGAYWSGNHDATVAMLPGVLADLRATVAAAHGADEEVARHALARVLWAAGSTLVHLKHLDAAFIATRRAVDLVARGEDPHLAAAVRGSLAWQLMVAGRYEESAELSLSSASAIEPDGGATLPALSAYGSLVLQAGNAAARAGKASRARDLLAEAAEVSTRVPDGRNDYSTAFGPSQVTMQSADILINLGEHGEALRLAGGMPNAGAALPKIARCRHLTDKALAHVKVGQHGPALDLVASATSMAPNWAKHQSLPKSVVRELLHTSPKRSSRLRTLAAQLGVR